MTLMSLLESQRSPNSHVSATDVVTALSQREIVFLCRGLELSRSMWFSLWGLKSCTSIETIDSVVEMSTILHQLRISSSL